MKIVLLLTLLESKKKSNNDAYIVFLWKKRLAITQTLLNLFYFANNFCAHLFKKLKNTAMYIAIKKRKEHTLFNLTD